MTLSFNFSQNVPVIPPYNSSFQHIPKFMTSESKHIQMAVLYTISCYTAYKSFNQSNSETTYTKCAFEYVETENNLLQTALLQQKWGWYQQQFWINHTNQACPGWIYQNHTAFIPPDIHYFDSNLSSLAYNLFPEPLERLEEAGDKEVSWQGGFLGQPSSPSQCHLTTSICLRKKIKKIRSYPQPLTCSVKFKVTRMEVIFVT